MVKDQILVTVCQPGMKKNLHHRQTVFSQRHWPSSLSFCAVLDYHLLDPFLVSIGHLKHERCDGRKIERNIPISHTFQTHKAF